MQSHIKERTRLIQSIFRAVERASCDYAVLAKGIALPFDVGNDIDVVVSPTSFNRFRRALQEAVAAAQGWSCRVNSRMWAFISYRCDAPPISGLSVRIDMFKNYCWAWLPFCNINALIASSKCEQGIRRAACGADAAIRIVKQVIRELPVNPQDLSFLSQSASNDPISFRSVLLGSMSRDIIDKLLVCAANSQWEQIMLRSTDIRKSLIQTKLRASPFPTILNSAPYVARRVIKASRMRLLKLEQLVGR